MKKPVTLLMIIMIGVLLAGCSFSDLFAELATTNEEAASSAEYAQNKINDAKVAKIAADKAIFPETAELKNVNPSTNFIASAFRKIVNNQTTITLEGLLTNPSPKQYGIWLKNDQKNSPKISVGMLQQNQTDDYSFSLTTNQNLKGYNTVIVSLDTPPATPGAQPEKIVVTGNFAPSFASPSASPIDN